ncbi:MAG: hemerythrin domain-containing protein [Candidatus Omnitrophica bacterium]|jgi:iron-sulfur cluster repair protein YtfE (RIC family)|nr:hemerythrin domain-containing protein [Candidatus Omnitrophota bacterium]
MDPLINLSQAHQKILEMPAMYSKILGTINFHNAAEYVKSLNKLFKDIVLPHFDFEEKEVFPLVTPEMGQGLQVLVIALKEEHKQIMEELAQLNKLNMKLQTSPDVSQAEKDKLAALCTKITRELTEHAQKEDESLFPYLRDTIF